jgi:hypothetical protein
MVVSVTYVTSAQRFSMRAPAEKSGESKLRSVRAAVYIPVVIGAEFFVARLVSGSVQNHSSCNSEVTIIGL